MVLSQVAARESPARTVANVARLRNVLSCGGRVCCEIRNISPYAAARTPTPPATGKFRWLFMPPTAKTLVWIF